MAVNAFVLLNAEASKHLEVIKGVKKIKGVKEAHVVTGLHDLVLYVTARDLKTLGNLIIKKIQAIPGVIRTVTCIAVD